MRQSVCVAIAGCVLLAGCGGRRRVVLPAAARVGSTETGVASWYGNPYHGRRSANGEVYDMEKMTAAHRTLPFETWVRVENLDTHKTVEVRITDRGPFVRRRILDLSHAAAVSIDMIGPGTAKVKLTVIAARTGRIGDPPAPQFAVQVGSFTDRRNAERVKSAMERRYGTATVVMREGSPAQWRVLVGREATQEDAEILAGRIRSDPAAKASAAFVVRVDSEPGSGSL